MSSSNFFLLASQGKMYRRRLLMFLRDKEQPIKNLMLFTYLRKTQLAWWIEIRTEIPPCTYYFGPFDSLKEAEISQHGYIEDLVEEKARGIKVELKRCQPKMLTISEE